MRSTKTILRIVTCVQRLTIRISFLFVSASLFAQVSDDFLDGDFTSNPAWMGDTSNFSVSSSSALPTEVAPSLRLQGENSDTSILILPTSFGEQMEWRFLVKLSFNTSSGNFARVYLISDNPNLKGPLTGIYLQIGGTHDSLKLVRQQGMEHWEFLTGQFSQTGNSSNLFRIRITRDSAGTWALFSDSEGGCAFKTEGTGFDPEPLEGTYFGFFCRYTSSNATKFYFDDVYIQDLYADTSAPVVDSVLTLSDTSQQIFFSEAVDFVSAKDTMNYQLNDGIGYPGLSEWSAHNKNQVSLKFRSPLPPDQVFTLTIENIRDLSGNMLIHENIPVVFSPPPMAGPYDIVLNEVMPDVSPPPPGLPQAEYIELFNRTDQAFQLEGYAVKPRESGSWIKFNKKTIPAGGYLVVTNTADSGLFLPSVQTIGLSGFFLNNEGVVVLRNPKGTVLDRLEYSKTGYDDEEKKNGGWSLEQIDPGQPCAGLENWSVAINSSGGTPGSLNSVDALNPVPLRITELDVKSDTVLQIQFNQVVSDSQATDPAYYVVDRGVGSPDLVLPADSIGNTFQLYFKPPLSTRILYELKFTSDLTNCVGMVVQIPDPVIFGIPEPPKRNDLVINELLFNPTGNGVDFVELYNRSQKIIDPSVLQLGEIDVDEFDIPDTTFKEVGLSKRLFLPGEYLVLSKDPEVVKEQYYCGDPSLFINMNAFPSMPNDEGVVVLATLSGSPLDIVEYAENMHHPLLISYEGVSLERIHFDRLSSDRTNWHSAASTAGFATPALLNSQFSKGSLVGDEVYVDPEVFSPDNDGMDDVTRLCYRFSDPGFTAKVMIYDARGRPVRYLSNNELLGSEGYFIWDGTTETGEKATIGIYLFFLEVMNTQGLVRKFKKSVVVAGKLH